MNNHHKSSHSVLPKGAVWPFILLSSCFLWWAIANNLTDPLVRVFKDIFGMSTFQASLIQMAFFGGYFCMALPGAMFARKFTYKTAVLLGLGLCAAGCFLTVSYVSLLYVVEERPADPATPPVPDGDARDGRRKGWVKSAFEDVRQLLADPGQRRNRLVFLAASILMHACFLPLPLGCLCLILALFVAPWIGGLAGVSAVYGTYFFGMMLTMVGREALLYDFGPQHRQARYLSLMSLFSMLALLGSSLIGFAMWSWTGNFHVLAWLGAAGTLTAFAAIAILREPRHDVAGVSLAHLRRGWQRLFR